MASERVVVHGVVHGRTIELEEEPGLRDGQAVQVTLRAALAPGEGLRRAFGSWGGNDDQLEQFVEEIYADRDDQRPEPTP